MTADQTSRRTTDSVAVSRHADRYSRAMTQAVESVEIAVAGDPARVRDTIAGALLARGFTVSWPDQWNGVATKGSRGRQLILGALAVYFEVNLNVFVVDDTTTLRLSRPSTGISGGMAGRMRAHKQFTTLAAEVTEVFRANGVLISPAAPPPATG